MEARMRSVPGPPHNRAHRNFRLDRPASPAYRKNVGTVMTHPSDAHLSQVDLLHRVSRIVSSELSLDEVLGEVLGLTVQVTSCEACLVYLLEKDTEEVILRASQVPHAAELGSLRMKVGEGITGWVAEHKSVVALPSNARSDRRFKKFAGLVEDTYDAFLSVPIVSNGETIGVVNVHHREPHEHTEEEISLVKFVGEQMGNAISRAKLVEENQRLAQEAEEIKRELETRKVVERAKGILMRNHGLSEEEAYLRLRGEARRMRRTMKELAEAIILAEELSRKKSDPSDR
jgi:signal transduction protein with GAF and PtsI domain